MSDAPKGRGRGRGRRIAATTLSGPLPSASPSASPAPPPPPPPQPSHNDDNTADATDDAPPPPAPTSAAAAAAPQRRASVKRVASVGVGSTRAPSVGSSMSRTPSLGPNAATPAPERAPRPVGGLLAVNSEYRASASSSHTGASAAGARPKFKPNMRRSLKVQDDDDDEDVKMEDGDSFRNKRGPRAPRARQDLEMTASGPMAQGPGGPPRAWGAGRPAGAGASGAAVMAASRAGTLNRMLDDDSDASDLEGGGYGSDAGGCGGGGGSGDEGAHVRRFKAVDLNDIGAEPGGGARDGEDEAVTPLTLPRDPKVLRTKIRRLQERKNERAKREARHAAKAQGLVKPEPTDDALPASTSTSTSATPLGGTPAPSATGIAPSTAASLIGAAAGTDSKEGSLALLSVDEDKEAKDLKDLEEEEKKEISLSEAFDLAPETRGELYMFQFPRKFPVFTPESSSSSATTATASTGAAAAGASSSSTVKPDPDAPAALRKPAAPAWGRFGSRAEKASRWTEHEGRIGQLRVHESGKVTLRIKGDLRYEVLPAAQPSFLQEVAILDHRAAAGSAAAANGNGHTNGTKTKKPKNRRRSSSSGSSSSSSSSSSDAGAGADQPSSRPKGRPVPPESLVVLGQTQKKFLVVPDINDLLASVAQQEKDERDEERRVKLERARGAGAAAGAGAGGGKGRR
ncbi:hypothetical protein JCM9279_005046 [Rhodotorula babjevae]